MKKQVNWSKNDRSATILGILHLRYMAQWEIVAPKELVDDFDANEKKIGREIVSVRREPVCRDATLSCCSNCTIYIVDRCTATGIRVAPEQAVIRSLGRYWNDNSDKLNKWAGDWVTKRQPAPDSSLSFPASRAFVRKIHENHTNNEWWPLHRSLRRNGRVNGVIPAHSLF